MILHTLIPGRGYEVAIEVCFLNVQFKSRVARFLSQTYCNHVGKLNSGSCCRVNGDCGILFFLPAGRPVTALPFLRFSSWWRQIRCLFFFLPLFFSLYLSLPSLLLWLRTQGQTFRAKIGSSALLLRYCRQPELQRAHFMLRMQGERFEVGGPSMLMPLWFICQATVSWQLSTCPQTLVRPWNTLQPELGRFRCLSFDPGCKLHAQSSLNADTVASPFHAASSIFLRTAMMLTGVSTCCCQVITSCFICVFLKIPKINPSWVNWRTGDTLLGEGGSPEVTGAHKLGTLPPPSNRLKKRRAYSPPWVDRIWSMWGSYYITYIPKAVFYLLKGEYRHNYRKLCCLLLSGRRASTYAHGPRVLRPPLFWEGFRI